MFSQLAKWSSKVLTADLRTDLCVTKTKVSGFKKEQKHGGRRRDCFSLFYFGNLQILLILCCFSDISISETSEKN